MAGLLLLTNALAQSAPPLKLLLTQDLVTVVTENGKSSEKITKMPAAVRPGDLLSEQVSASNTSKAVLRNAVVRLNIPVGTQYSAGMSAGERWKTEYSADAGKTFAAAPLMKTIALTENGRTVQRQVVIPPSEYTGVRWTLPTLNPDETLKLSFRVTVK